MMLSPHGSVLGRNYDLFVSANAQETAGFFQKSTTQGDCGPFPGGVSSRRHSQWPLRVALVRR